MGKPHDGEIRTVVTEALVGMIAGVTNMVPPTDQALPDFIQAPVDRAVERIKVLLGTRAAGLAVPDSVGQLLRAYRMSSTGRYDAGAPAHNQTIAIVQFLDEVEDEEEAWEAIRTYADMRVVDALFKVIELLSMPPTPPDAAGLGSAEQGE